MKKVKILDFKLNKSIWNLLFWLYKNKFHFDEMSFEKHKEYVFWDSVKNIDWKASNKTNKLYTKVFEAEKNLDVLFLLDLNPSMNFYSEKLKKIDLLEEIFYALAFSVIKNNNNFSVYFYWTKEEKFLNYKNDFSQILKTLEIIEKFENNEKIDENRTKKILQKLNSHKIKNKLIFILTDDIFEKDKNLKILAMQNEIIFINIFDFLENNLGKKDKNFTFFGENNFLNIFLNSKKIEEFNAFRKEKIKKFERMLKKYKIEYIYIDTKMDSFSALVSYFSKR